MPQAKGKKETPVKKGPPTPVKAAAATPTTTPKSRGRPKEDKVERMEVVDTGPCGSSLSSDAPTHRRFSPRSRSARRNTLDAELESSDSTESDRCRWLDSSPESKVP